MRTMCKPCPQIFFETSVKLSKYCFKVYVFVYILHVLHYIFKTFSEIVWKAVNFVPNFCIIFVRNFAFRCKKSVCWLIFLMIRCSFCKFYCNFFQIQLSFSKHCCVFWQKFWYWLWKQILSLIKFFWRSFNDIINTFTISKSVMF